MISYPPPQARWYLQNVPSLELISLKFGRCRAFVKMSAIYCCEVTCFKVILPLIFSSIKWQSILTYLILSRWSGAIAIVDWLSQKTFIGPSSQILSSPSNCFSNILLQISCAKAQNYASALLRATTCCAKIQDFPKYKSNI